MVDTEHGDEMTLEEAVAEVMQAKRDMPMLFFKPYDDKQRSVLRNTKRRCAVIGGNRCVAGDTIISGKRIDSFGYFKGTGQLWDIGGYLRCSCEHRVLTPSGYSTISSLLQLSEDQRFLLISNQIDSNLEHDLLAHVLGDLSSWRKAQDFQSDYLSYFRSCGGQPRLNPRVGQGGVPSPDDALSCKISSQYEQEYTRFYQPSYHLSKMRDDGLLPQSFVVKDPDCEPASLKFPLRIQEVPISSLPLNLSSNISQQLSRQNKSFSSIFLLLWEDLRLVEIAIPVNVSIKKDKIEDFYDCNIPLIHTYNTNGVISHNSGKTTIGAYWMMCHLSGDYPEFWPEEARFKPPIRARIIIEEYKEHGPVLVNKIKSLANKGFVDKWYKNPQGYITGFDCVNGSQVSILTHEQQTDSHEGWDGHVIWSDEPIPKDKFIANTRGLVDHNGFFLITMTPLKEPWLADELFEENSERWNVINLEVQENPHISKQALEDFYSSIDDPDQLEARKTGKFVHLSGAIYHQFQKQKHVVPSRKLPDHWPRFCVVDPHDRRPFAIGWYAVDPMNRIWCYDEYPNSLFHKIKTTELKTEDFATIIRNTEGRSVIANRIIDRRYGYRRQTQSGTTIQEELNSYDLFFTPSYDDAQGGIEAGHICVKEYLGRKDQEPRLLIMEHCKNHIYAMTHYIYDEKTGKPKENAKDFADLIRYMCMSKPDYDMWQDDPTHRLDNIENGVDRQGHGIDQSVQYPNITHTYEEF